MIDPNTSAEKVLYAFKQADGNFPFAPLIAANGLLYGAIYNGGVTGCGDIFGCGVAFSVDPASGAEKVLYRFCSAQNRTDGQNPEGSM